MDDSRGTNPACASSLGAYSDGGPAFPKPSATVKRFGHHPYDDTEETQDGYDGMTLRDWFAGQALRKFLSKPEQMFGADVHDTAEAARLAYLYADAMLKAREEVQ
jgi:hypothetical protein